MKELVTVDRRGFLRSAAAGAAGMYLGGPWSPLRAAGSSACAWTDMMPINPAIDNLRVVSVKDTGMITGEVGSWDTSADQNSVVDASKVEENLDAMAVQLSGKATSAEAWKTIFQKPEGKKWSNAKVAIKLNATGLNIPRAAVVGKVCAELRNRGVALENIVIYDGEGAAFDCVEQKLRPAVPFQYGPFLGGEIPEGVVLSDYYKALGGTKPVEVPEPYAGSFPCAKALVEGTVDILVNIAACQGHGKHFFFANCCLRNQLGTFTSRPGGRQASWKYVAAINKSNPVVGGTPPRQQLCIVDALWSAGFSGPGNIPGSRVDRLVMGTFAGAVDYLTVTKVRRSLVHGHTGWNQEHRMLTRFGYPESAAESLDFAG